METIKAALLWIIAYTAGAMVILLHDYSIVIMIIGFLVFHLIYWLWKIRS
jgi:hypothetical protein